MKKIYKFILVMVMLLCLCIIPQISNVFLYSTKEVNTAASKVLYSPNNWKYTLIKEDPVLSKPVSLKQRVEQKLSFEGEIKNIDVFLQCPSKGAYQDWKVTFSLVQEEKKLRVTINGNELPLQGYYSIPIVMASFEEGSVLLSIESEGMPEGTDAFCFVSDWQASELPNSIANKNDLGGVLYLKYTYTTHNQYFWYDIAFLVAVIILIFCISWLFTYKKEHYTNSIWFYLTVTALIFLTKCLENPLMSYLGEPMSEAVYDFWYNAQYKSFFGNLMTMMSGESLVWPERIIMSITKLISPTPSFFRITMLIELAMISLLTAMPCLPRFNKFFSPAIRMALSLLFSCIIIAKAYLPWSISYWCTLWFIGIAFTDWKKIKRWQYFLILLVTLIFSVSRVYYIVLIPISILAIILLGKKQGKRFVGYWCTIILGVLFQLLYSFIYGNAGMHIEGGQLNIGTALANTFYWQAQIIISLFTGTQHVEALLLNGIVVLSVLLTVGLFIYTLLKKRYELSFALGSLGMFSLGTIMINIVTCMMSTSVHFETTYGAPANWNQTYYQRADLHFSFAYFCTILIILTILWMAKKKENTKSDNLMKTYHSGCAFLQSKSISTTITCIVIIVLMFLCPHERINMRDVFVDWDSSAMVSEQNEYYISVNNIYPVAHLSMNVNTNPIIIAHHDDGTTYEWKEGLEAYNHDEIYDSISTANFEGIINHGVKTLTISRAENNFNRPITAVFIDEEGKEIARVNQSSDSDRYWIDFYPETPLVGVASVKFLTPDGYPAYYWDALQFGVLKE